MKIIELEAQNVKKLRRVRIAPDGNVTIIGGDEGQGKSTVLDCVVMALAGTKHVSSVPIRTGETEAAIKLTLGEKGEKQLTVERTFDAAKGTSLVVRGPDGKKLPGGPQEILNKLFSMVGFKPLQFASEDPDKQAETLRKLVGIDFAPVDAEIKALYDQRTEVGRDGKTAAGQLAGITAPADGTPDDEVSIKDLLAEKEAAERANANADKVARDHADANVKLNAIHDEIERLENAIKDLKEKARQATDLVRELDDAMDETNGKRVDLAPIREKLANVETVNRAVRAKKEHAKKTAEVARLREEYAELTTKIEALEASKGEMLAKAKWPIEGLGFGSNGITYKGLPFDQASRGERYRVSIAIGMALNPQLRVLLLEDASVLDKHAMQAVREMAEAKDYDVWIERVGDGDAGALIMVDGEIKAGK